MRLQSFPDKEGPAKNRKKTLVAEGGHISSKRKVAGKSLSEITVLQGASL